MAKAKNESAGAAAVDSGVTAASGAGDSAGAADGGAAAGAQSVIDEARATAAAAGVDVSELTDEDIADLVVAAKADEARTGRKPGKAKGPNFVREQTGKDSMNAISLLLEACDIYGVNPSADQTPRELLAWKFYPGEDDPARGVQPDAVVIVTGGGLKLKHYDDPDMPMDPDTVQRLQRAFSLFRQDPTTKQIVALALPADLTLPAASVNGIGTTDHQYHGGYLKSGGTTAAADKQKRRDERAKRLGLA